MSVPSAEDQIRFLVRVQRILDEGKFTSTYKFALLLALAQISIEQGDGSGGPLSVTTHELAKHFVRQYWRQLTPFAPADGRTPRVLKQIRTDEAEILRRIDLARKQFAGSLSALVREPSAWAELLKFVATKIERMPLWKLQTVGREQLRFLYDKGTRRHEIVLEAGVAYSFRRFHPLIQDLVQAAWIRFVRRIKANQDLVGGGHELGAFLFGSERSTLAAFQSILWDVQNGRCFYCPRAIGGEGVIDHFIPWSRYAIDLGHNFVLAHGTCNARKSDRLPAFKHLASWCDRNVEAGSLLADRFDEKGLLHDLTASRQITAWAYRQAQEADAQVWLQGDLLDSLDPKWQELPGMGPS